jgi:hypothetical protein
MIQRQMASDTEPSLADEVELARVTGSIAAPAEAIWTILLDFGRPQRLAPSIERCECLGVGEGAVRRVQARGLVIYEQLVEADRDALVFRYVILPSGDMPLEGVTSYAACVRLRAIVTGSTEIEWSSRGKIEGSLAPISAAFGALYDRAIENIRSILDSPSDAPRA